LKKGEKGKKWGRKREDGVRKRKRNVIRREEKKKMEK